MPINAQYRVDFSKYRVNSRIERALGRMLSQHYDKCVLRQFVATLIKPFDELYEAIIDMQEQRTVYEAVEDNLSALGRIVGEDRSQWQYSEEFWMFFDRAGQGYDQSPMWVKGAPMGTYQTIDDNEYRINVVLKAIKNHTLTASIPEVTELIEMAYGIGSSFLKTGPNIVKPYIDSSVSTNTMYRLFQPWNDSTADRKFWAPFPATLSFDENIVFVPKNFMIFDVKGRGWDTAPFAVETKNTLI